MSDRDVDSVADNDVVLKAVCYGLQGAFWPNDSGERPLGLLGAARYVLGEAIARPSVVGDKDELRAALHEFLASTVMLEPNEPELALATELEAVAQRAAHSLDSGESQLAAIVVLRSLNLLETGDKRAIRSLEFLLDRVGALTPLAGRVRSLEQIVARVLSEGDFEKVRQPICAQPRVDKTLSICFSCTLGGGNSANALECLQSYISDLRSMGSRVLEVEA